MPERFAPQEQVSTPEKSTEELYLDALEKKRDTLLAFHTMNSFRKNRSPEDMSSEEIEQYKVLREEWRFKKEASMSVWDVLSEDKQEELTAMGSRLYDVQAQLTLLKPKETLKSEQKTPEPAAPDAVAEVEAEKELAQPAPEKPESALSLQEAKKMRQYAKDTGRMIELTYWEQKVAELQERQEAEANPDQTLPKGFMQRVKAGFTRGLDKIERSLPGDDFLVKSGYAEYRNKEGRVVDKEGKPIEPTQSEVVQPQFEATSQQPEKEPKKETTWSLIKERARGLITPFGWREFTQANMMWTRTGEISDDTKVLSTLIQQERNLNQEEAEKEAWEIIDTLKEQGLTISAPEFYEASKDITERKRKENDEEIAYIAKSTEGDIYDKLQKYRGEGGQDVLTRENQLAIRADLTGELNKLRDGAFRKDFVNYAKLMRRNLDSKWGWRYVWGSIDAALWWIGIFAVSMKFLASKEAAAMGAKLAAGGAGSAEAAREFVETGMHENIWNTLKEMAENGPGKFTPDGAQLKEWSQATLDAIKHYEPEWVANAVEGLKSSRAMPEGFPLKVPAEVMKAMGY